VVAVQGLNCSEQPSFLPKPPPSPNIRKVISYVAEDLAYAPERAFHQSSQLDHSVTDINDTGETDPVDTFSNIKSMEEHTPIDSTKTIITHDIPTSDTTCTIAMIHLLTHAATQGIPIHQTLRLHIDGGANRSITNDKSLLIKYKNIKKHYMSSAAGDNDIACTGLGYIPWRASDGTVLLIKCYYSTQAPETIVSPSDVVMDHLLKFHTWTQHADFNSEEGHIEFTNKDNGSQISFPLQLKNGLWYYIHDDTTDYSPTKHPQSQPIVHRLTTASLYELIHARLGHPGERVMQNIHKHTVGIPKLKKPPLFRCGACSLVNATKRAISQKEVSEALHQSDKHTTDNESTTMTSPNIVDINNDNKTPQDDSLLPGQTFQADMGFVRGTKYQQKGEDGQIITSMDGFNSYLLVIDRATRYTWIFLSRTKAPPVNLLKGFLTTHGTRHSVLKRIRTDKGGELWGSHEFQRTMKELNYILEPTAPDASFQNGVAERPNRSLADIMRSLLQGAQLGPEYWSWALLHAVYLKNRLIHRALGKTPFEAYTGHQPNLRHLRVFGCPVTVRNVGRRPAKLDSNASAGVFLGFTATSKNIYYFDTTTNRVKTGTHVMFILL